MIFLSLFLTFLQIGLFGFGGGYGMLSLIQSETVVRHAWLTSAEFTNIVAISQMTPGPIGINSATYCGYTAVRNAGYGELMGVLGSATATLALVLPSFIIMVLVCRMFMKYIHSQTVQSVLSGLRPAVVGLIGAAALLLMNAENFSSPLQNPWQFGVSIALFVATYVGTQTLKINPIRMIAWAAFAGLMLLY
jgi:chromate transporter|uniref:chromate transporter n=1 Tax=Prevotella sp. TaxID=59823 RepID=UPI003FEE5916